MLVVLARPSGLAWFFSVREVAPGEVAHALSGPTPPLLLDVRTEEEYRSGHVAGARWVPLGMLGGFVASRPVPAERDIVTVCTHGRRSAAGAAEIAARGHTRVSSLAGGTAAWQTLGLPVEIGRSEPSPGKVTVVETTLLEQGVALATGFVVKPIYMILALALGLFLRRRRDRDLSLLGKGMLLFFVGEALCALRFLGAGPGDPLEIGHGLGMVAMGAWVSWGLLEFVDHRALGYSDPARACVLGRFCQRCWKREAVPCGLYRIMLFLLPVLAILAIVPLTARPRPMLLDYPVFGTMVRDETTPLIEILQIRVYPLLALWLFGVAFLDLCKGKAGLERAKAPFFVGMGFLSYALLRFLLQQAFGEAVFWANAWEEVTELATVLSLIWILWTFRAQLDLRRPEQSRGI
jgi:rhodanese-related sulfurtransferase